MNGTERYVCTGGVHLCVHMCVVATCPYRYQQRARRGFAGLNHGSLTVRTNKVCEVSHVRRRLEVTLSPRGLSVVSYVLIYLCQLKSHLLMYERSLCDPLRSGTKPLCLISQIHDSSTYCIATRQRFITGFFLLVRLILIKAHLYW